MAKQPSVTKLIDFSMLYRADNVRDETCTRIPDMVSSLKVNGFKVNHPLVVSLKADNRALVLCGNRREEALEHLQANDLEAFKAALPGGKVPCIVYTGLTEEEEILLRIDHGPQEDRVPLSEWGKFLAIKQLLRAYPGESQAKIAEKLGIFNTKGKGIGEPNRSYVQVRVNLARLPEYIQAEFKKLSVSGNDATPVRWSNVKELYTAFNAEFGPFPDGDGPQLKTAWEKIINPAPEVPVDDTTPKPTSLSPEAARARAQNAASKAIKRVYLAATGQGGDIVQIDSMLLEMETSHELLGMIRAYLGADEYASLVNRSREHRVAEETAQAERNRAEAEAKAAAEAAPIVAEAAVEVVVNS
jgi:hypothetical protein